MRPKWFLPIISAILLASACATSQSMIVAPPGEPSPDKPRLWGADLYEETGKDSSIYVPKSDDGNYYFATDKHYHFKASVSRAAKIRVVKVFNKVDIWREFASGKALNGTKTFEYDLSSINDCCLSVWAPWWNSFAYDPGYYATFTMWVIDESGRTSNSVTIGPIVVKSEGGSVVPKAW